MTGFLIRIVYVQDVISLVELVNDQDFREAASWLAMEYNVSVPETVSDTRKRDDKFYTQAALNEEIYRFGKYILSQPDGGETRQYLIKYRGQKSSEDI